MDFGRTAIRIGVVTGVLLAILGLGFMVLNSPPGPPSQSRLIEIPRGSSFHRISHLLYRERLIGHEWFFTLLARITGGDRKIIPGEYELHAGMTSTEILSKMVDGRVFYHSVTIPEGYTVLQIANILAEKRLTDREAFLALTRDPAFIQTLGLPVPTLEGFLFPDTYLFPRPMPPAEVIRAFVNRFWVAFSPELQARAEEMQMSIPEVVTLASVIEKETALAQERALVSGVFHNRLKRNMPLQSDPTVIYALEGFDGDLRKRDLAIDSPYNTYRVRGLPPGPIANPGEAAIRAALYPTETKYVYFVSRNDGSHEFSSTLAEHNQAVKKYQLGGGHHPS